MKNLILLLLLLSLYPLAAQIGAPSKTGSLVRQAIELVDNGKMDEGMRLLKEAKTLDPNDYSIDYEIAYIYVQQKKYKKAIDIYEEILKEHAEAEDLYYQMLGNAYDMNGQPEKALVAYQRGLNAHPKSGKLYSEMAIVHGRSYQNWDRAVELWEEGIKADPTYPTTYFWLTKIFSQTSNPGWALLYGEVFLNLQPGSPRAEEVSKMLYDIWNQVVTTTSDTSAKFYFFSSNLSTDDMAQMMGGKMPFALRYSLCLSLGSIPQTLVRMPEGLAYYSKMQQGGMEEWFAGKHNETYPNVLLDWQRTVADSGHFEAYSMWMLRKGDPAGFKTWLETHKEAFEAFADWFKENDLPLSESTYFCRCNYINKKN